MTLLLGGLLFTFGVWLVWLMDRDVKERMKYESDSRVSSIHGKRTRTGSNMDRSRGRNR